MFTSRFVQGNRDLIHLVVVNLGLSFGPMFYWISSVSNCIILKTIWQVPLNLHSTTLKSKAWYSSTTLKSKAWYSSLKIILEYKLCDLLDLLYVPNDLFSLYLRGKPLLMKGAFCVLIFLACTKNYKKIDWWRYPW